MSLPPESLSSEPLVPEEASLAAQLLPAPSVRLRLPKLHWLFRLGALLLIVILLFVALREAPIRAIWQTLGSLRVWQVLVLLALNALIYLLITARWWLVVRSEAPRIPYLPMIGVRLSTFAISYFTVGPQIGGEPLQVLYLRRRQALSYTRATASVLMDKLFELLGNFVLLSLGLMAIFRTGLLSTAGGAARLALLALVVLVTWPLVHIVLLYRRVYPLSRLIQALGERTSRSRAARFLRAAERLAGRFCQRHPRMMIYSLAASLLAAIVTVSEYVLITSFLGIHMPFWQLVTAWTIGWLSFLVPVPGGVGALEASQVIVLGTFGVSAATALGVVLIMRGRDLIFGGLGLLFAGLAAKRW